MRLAKKSKVIQFPSGDAIPVDDFYHPSSDARGHNSPVSVKVPPDLSARLEKLFASGAFPYSTKSDLIRHAMARHLAFLDRLQADNRIPGNEWARYEAMRALTLETERQKKFRETLQSLSDNVGSLKSEGLHDQAAKIVYQIGKIVETMEEPWRSKYQREIESRFGDLLDQRGRASLRNWGD